MLRAVSSHVSILTGLRRPVLLCALLKSASGVALFQSSPACEGRCYLRRGHICSGRCRAGFNPHRPAKAGATVPTVAVPKGVNGACFNPHRPAKAGATARFRTLYALCPMFQSSPACEGRCYGTRHEALSKRNRFQSSPACEGRCYKKSLTTPTARTCFNPHRPAKAGATRKRAIICARMRRVSILTGLRRPVLRSILEAKTDAAGPAKPELCQGEGVRF